MLTQRPSNARRREVRRNRPDRVPAWWLKLRRREVGWAILFVAMLTTLGGIIALSSRLQPEYRIGQPVDEHVVARAAFTAVNEELTRREKEKSRAAVLDVYSADQRYFEELRERLTSLLSLAERNFDELTPEVLDGTPLTRAGHELLGHYQETAQDSRDATLAPEAWQEKVEAFLRGFFDVPVLAEAEFDEVFEAGGLIQIVKPLNNIDGEDTHIVQSRALMSMGQPDAIRDRVRQSSIEIPAELRATAEHIVLADVKPTYFRDETQTVARQLAAYDAAPLVTEPFSRGELLVSEGVRLTEDQFRLLEAEREAFEGQITTLERVLSRAALGGVLAMLFAGVWMYLFVVGSRVASNPTRGLAVATLLLLGQALAVIAEGLWPSAPIGGVLFPTMLVTIVLAVVYSQPFALVLGTAHALLVTLTLDRGAELTLVLLAGVAVAVWQLHDIRSRSKLVVVGGLAGFAMAVATTLVSILGQPPASAYQWQRLGINAGAAAASGFAAGLLVQGMLPLIERAFRVTTAMSLKELNDNAKPLLKRLAHEAPGTYQHSLRIADMAEAAADAIGADGLLARVGAMYHDVGKINKPHYFIENQGGGPNKHNKLSPAMSLLLIVGHVKDGVEMAREYGLPRCLIHFIESHHGTTLVEYFYHAAKKQNEEKQREATGQVDPDEAPSEFEFRYPGPKPQTKEAAILLICDGIEAAARACEEPTPARLQQITHSIAMKRLMDGQFDACNLTLAELGKIEKAIVKTLCAIYHSRIKYPAGQSNTATDSAPSRSASA
ncbi:MAG: HDIG domain-containing metalloprotein [Planctomycetota bacterium]